MAEIAPKKDNLDIKPPLSVIEGEKERELRAWKAAAWAPVVVGLIDLAYETFKHLAQ